LCCYFSFYTWYSDDIHNIYITLGFWINSPKPLCRTTPVVRIVKNVVSVPKCINVVLHEMIKLWWMIALMGWQMKNEKICCEEWTASQQFRKVNQDAGQKRTGRSFCDNSSQENNICQPTLYPMQWVKMFGLMVFYTTKRRFVQGADTKNYMPFLWTADWKINKTITWLTNFDSYECFTKEAIRSYWINRSKKAQGRPVTLSNSIHLTASSLE